MPRDIMADLEAMSQRFLEIKEAIENEEYDLRGRIDTELVDIGLQIEELREIVANWQFNSLSPAQAKAALL